MSSTEKGQPDQVHDILMVMKSRGFFINSQRRIIVGILMMQGKPVTVEELWLSIRRISQKACIASIYNNLNLLVQEGFLERDIDAKGKSRYSLKKTG